MLTHRISLRPPSGGVCGCQEELGRVLGRLEGLEREVSALRASCTAGAGCCSSSTESKGTSTQPLHKIHTRYTPATHPLHNCYTTTTHLLHTTVCTEQ